jgi:hypothetical protein
MGFRIEAPKQDGNARFSTLKVNLQENNATTRGVVVDTEGNFYFGTPAASTGSIFPFTGSAIISGSLTVYGPIIAPDGITGSLFGTASWAQNALTASYIDAGNVVGLNLSRITTGSVTASVDVGPNTFLITSESIEFFKINTSGSVIQGLSTTAYGEFAHSEGFGTSATGAYAHAEGLNSIASGYNSHAEGSSTLAEGVASHAEGYFTEARGFASHAEGNATVTSGSYQTTVGAFNLSSSAEAAFIIGNGTGDSTRSNLLFAQGNTVDITGSLNISGSETIKGYIQFEPVTTNINNSISSSYIYVSGSTQDLYFTQNGGGFSNTTRLRWLEGNLYTGILTGGVVSGSIGGTTFNVSSGSGIIVTMNATTASREPYPTVKYISWPNFTNVTPTYLTTHDTTWLLIDSNSNLIQQTNSPSNGQFDNNIQIGSLVHPNLSTISLYKTFTVTSYAIAQQVYEFIRVFGAIKVSGHTLTPSGSSLSINRSSGVAYAIGRNYINDANKPSLVSDIGYNRPSIFRYYKSGSVFATATGTDVLDPAQYNTPSSPTGLSAAPGGQYTIQRVYYFPNQPNIVGVYYGRELYNSISTAQSNLPYEVFEENSNTLAQAIFAGYIILKSGTTDLSNTSDAKFIQAGAFRNTTGGGGGGTAVTSLADLSDVGLSSPTQGDLLIYNGAEWQNGKTIISLTGSFFGPLQGTSSWAQNAVTASNALSASFLIGADYSRIVTGSITASVNAAPNNLFLIKSASVEYLNISSSGDTTISSNQFIIQNFTTKRPILTVSQSIVQIATHSVAPTGTTLAGSIYFTTNAMYIGLD